MSPKNIKLTIEYDGTEYAGWQIQPDVKTVQGEIEKALRTILQQNIRIISAGRTDSGVHAINQVVNFTCQNSINKKQLKKSLNSLLPDDIVIKDVVEVPENFNARYDAKSRKYKYIISKYKRALNRLYSWYVPYKLDILAMKKAAKYLIGEKDFTSFSKKYPEETNCTCKIEKIDIKNSDEEITITIVANRFLHSMVRIIVGILVETGKGRFAPEDIKKIIEEKNFKYNKYLAPAKGLFLENITY
ncbi:tRNA pseudouridine(38-40) synthase TruA [candidate division KSB1 bacterium]|nr:MAG: tRNA pseudouridine(38-40) synthase TruA [candidate division KSB1 bacterium]